MKNLLFILAITFSLPCFSEETPKIIAVVKEVHDGDTFYIDIPHIHPVFGKRIPVRVRGIDTPELRSIHKAVREKALEAKELAECKLLGQEVILFNIKRDKYFRLNAEIKILETGENFGQFMLDIRAAKPYNGGTKDVPKT